MLRQFTTAILRLLIGAVFAASGILKVLHPEAFERALETYGFFSSGHIRFLSLAVPGIEIPVGLMLLVGWHTRTVIVVVIALLTGFVGMSSLSALEGAFSKAPRGRDARNTQ